MLSGYQDAQVLAGAISENTPWARSPFRGDYTPKLSLKVNRQDRMIGKFASRKTGVRLPYFSSYERDLYYLLEADPDVLGYASQPAKLTFVLDGVERTHVPDCLVVTTSGQYLIEVKPRSMAEMECVKARTTFLSQVLRDVGFTYSIATETQIYAEPTFSNARVLCRYRAFNENEAVTFAVREYIRRFGPTRISVLIDIFKEYSYIKSCILSATLRSRLRLAPGAAVLSDPVLCLKT